MMGVITIFGLFICLLAAMSLWIKVKTSAQPLGQTCVLLPASSFNCVDCVTAYLLSWQHGDVHKHVLPVLWYVSRKEKSFACMHFRWTCDMYSLRTLTCNASLTTGTHPALYTNKFGLVIFHHRVCVSTCLSCSRASVKVTGTLLTRAAEDITATRVVWGLNFRQDKKSRQAQKYSSSWQ